MALDDISFKESPCCKSIHSFIIRTSRISVSGTIVQLGSETTGLNNVCACPKRLTGNHSNNIVEPIGCYKDKSARAIPVLLYNFRGAIDWYHMDNTINDCAKKAQEIGFKLFGVQYYGECWSGSADDVAQYDRYGSAPPKNCWNGVGKLWTNYVYKIV
ncbi:hypothetical protein OS493_000944 [Desmophyllum pertusum]|uniref:Uncharacterized protein n=1 Tax=Desmophyllum pertusum TaxID=174260 RepID=A0A9W9ZX45_9CNID|nr:hypothetical protein OS493_000944 [Desmophyllum pertusum]